ncbi:MAG: DAK2 domain-containing protein [Actinomycetota bacterium]|nr:DAK2 domain-containing protein [Actinomycetota bacterium]
MPTLEFLDAAALRDTITTFRDAVRTHAERINRLNVYPVPDGDTGTNMSRTLDAVVAELEDTPASGAETCDAISHGSLMGARGNSGVILSQIMRGLAGTLREALVSSAKASGSQVAEALQAASTAAYEAVLKPIEGTILTVVRESAEGAKQAAGDGGSLVEVLRAARDAARSALEQTPELLPVLKDAGVVDAGGAGYLLLLDAALHVVDGEPLPESELDASLPVLDLHAVAAAHDADGAVADLRYEVMYFVDLADERIDEFKAAWSEIGDSIVVVGGDGLFNCHVHTNDIGAAIESAIALDGRPSQIRVTDLFGEVVEEHDRRQAARLGSDTTPTVATTAQAPPRSVVGLPAVHCAVVAVASGQGLAELFVQLGVQGVVTGGQTMNPSTAELLDFAEHVNADEVILLPNNKNIIPVAEQVDALTTKTVIVVPTVSMPEALAALIVYDPEVDAATNAASMAAATVGVVTGEVTRAVRATKSDAGPVEEGDWIALVRGDGVVAVAPTLDEIVVALLDRIVRDEHELVTVVAGADASAAATAAIERWVADAGLDSEVHRGEQPLYPYLVGVE